jgi:glycosyltransferase involved in cell wall biosynthesis
VILYDHTDTFRYDMGTGIQRVVKQLGSALVVEAPSHVEAVVFSRGSFRRCGLRRPDNGVGRIQVLRRLIRQANWLPLNLLRSVASEYRSLRRVKAGLWAFIGASDVMAPPLRPERGDWYLTADSIWERPEVLTRLPALRARGVGTAVVHYDLMAITHSDWCDPRFARAFVPYAEALSGFDVVFCISDFVREEFLHYCRRKGVRVPATVSVIPLGHEIDQPSSDASGVATRPLPEPFILCVGSLEPRKNHRALLDAFDLVWARGVDLSLVIVGRPGYASGDTVARIRSHLRFDRNLFHLSGCSDEELEQLYRRCAFTIVVSLFEGFGLPLVESLARGKPCISSDLPVFKASARDFGVYVNPEDPQSIAAGILGLYGNPERLEALIALISAGYKQPSWKDCARVVLDTLGSNRYARHVS